MKNNILEFDKREISIDEIRENVDYYISMAKKGFEFLNDNNKKVAMEVLKEIRIYMKEEFSYYSKSKVQRYINANNMYMTYYNGLYEAFAKQNRPTAYETLSSNLYDIEDYMSNYGMEVFR
ncbi:hypothetical protein UT300007_17220 [Clostridium sp. CTA-7]